MSKAVAACFALLSCVALAADKPDITGTWVCNTARSKMGKMSAVQGMTLKVERKGEVLHAVQTSEDTQGSKSVEGDWFLDGKVHPADMSAGNKMTSMSRWDGDTLVAERKSDDGTLDEKMRITFSADRKTATERVTTKSPNGSNSSIVIWEKRH